MIFGLPTASCEVGSLAAHDCLTSKAALDQVGLFVNDTWSAGRLTVNAGVRYDRYHGWLPEQEQLAATVGPTSVPARSFAETSIDTWNQVAPRVGVVFDLGGNGRTVVKANYGLYWHNPGVGVSQNGNPNIANKSETYAWNDANGDRRWQPGEQGAAPTAQALEGAIRVASDLRAPYTHEASVWIERQLTDTMGVRGGFVYKTEDDLITNGYQLERGPEAYTVPFTFVDIGVDGRRGTADDRNLTMYGMPSSQAANFPTTRYVTNTPQFARYKTVEASLNKRYGSRWSASLGGAYTMLHDFPNAAPNSYPNTPNQPGVEDRTTWNFKASGSYDGPWGVRISPVVRHQSGANYARTAAISAPAGSGLVAAGASTLIFVEPMDANREDNIWVFDVRAEKSITVSPRLRIRAYVDAFNLTNSHASETISRATGLSYQKPSAILAPFTTRVGFRVLF